MSKLILGLVGPIASGKGTVKKYIEEKYGGKDCRFSTILRDVLSRIDVTINRENLQRVSTVLRKTFGEDLLAKAIASDAAKLDSDVVVVDGVRRMADIAHLKNLPHFRLIAIDANPEIRYERMKTRNENEGDNGKTFEQFMEDHEKEADREIPSVMKQAVYLIKNDGSPRDLFTQVDFLLKKEL